MMRAPGARNIPKSDLGDGLEDELEDDLGEPSAALKESLRKCRFELIEYVETSAA